MKFKLICAISILMLISAARAEAPTKMPVMTIVSAHSTGTGTQFITIAKPDVKSCLAFGYAVIGSQRIDQGTISCISDDNRVLAVEQCNGTEDFHASCRTRPFVAQPYEESTVKYNSP